MAIGTEIKIGWQAQDVKRGLAALPAMFKGAMGKAMGAFKAIGKGAGLAAGGDLFGMIKDALLFIPRELDTIRQLADTYGNLSRATGIAAADLMQVTKAMQLSGLEADLSIDTFRELSTKLGEAAKGPGEIREALRDLGVDPNLLNGKVTDQMMRLANAVENFSGTDQDLAFAFDRIFGGDLGAKLISFFKQYDHWMGEASHSSRGFADALMRNRESLSLMPRIGAALRTKFREALLASFESTNQMGSHGILKQLVRYVEGIDVSKLAAVFNRVFKAALMGGEWLAGVIKEKGFSAAMGEAFPGLRDMIKATISEGIRMGIKEGLNVWNMLKPSMGGIPGMGSVSSLVSPQSGRDATLLAAINKSIQSMLGEQRRASRSLYSIENSGFPSVAV